MGQLIEKEVEQWEEQFRFSAEMIEEMTDAERYYFLLLFRQSILKTGIILKEQQMESILDQWQQKKPMATQYWQ